MTSAKMEIILVYLWCVISANWITGTCGFAIDKAATNDLNLSGIQFFRTDDTARGMSETTTNGVPTTTSSDVTTTSIITDKHGFAHANPNQQQITKTAGIILQEKHKGRPFHVEKLPADIFKKTKLLQKVLQQTGQQNENVISVTNFSPKQGYDVTKPIVRNVVEESATKTRISNNNNNNNNNRRNNGISFTSFDSFDTNFQQSPPSSSSNPFLIFGVTKPSSSAPTQSSDISLPSVSNLGLPVKPTLGPIRINGGLNNDSPFSYLGGTSVSSNMTSAPLDLSQLGISDTNIASASSPSLPPSTDPKDFKYFGNDRPILPIESTSANNNEIVGPFPFGKGLDGNENSKPVNPTPTMTAIRSFTDNSRKPGLKMTSKFLDLSGRQPPRLKVVGGFKEVKVTTTTTPVPSNYPATAVPGPSLTGIGLPGVVESSFNSEENNAIPGVNSVQSTSNSISNNQDTTNISPIANNNKATITKFDLDNSKTSPGNIAPTPTGENLKVDMLYPQAPFPANAPPTKASFPNINTNTATIPNSGQSSMSSGSISNVNLNQQISGANNIPSGTSGKTNNNQHATSSTNSVLPNINTQLNGQTITKVNTNANVPTSLNPTTFNANPTVNSNTNIGTSRTPTTIQSGTRTFSDTSSNVQSSTINANSIQTSDNTIASGQNTGLTNTHRNVVTESGTVPNVGVSISNNFQNGIPLHPLNTDHDKFMTDPTVQVVNQLHGHGLATSTTKQGPSQTKSNSLQNLGVSGNSLNTQIPNFNGNLNKINTNTFGQSQRNSLNSVASNTDGIGIPNGGVFTNTQNVRNGNVNSMDANGNGISNGQNPNIVVPGNVNTISNQNGNLNSVNNGFGQFDNTDNNMNTANGVSNTQGTMLNPSISGAPLNVNINTQGNTLLNNQFSNQGQTNQDKRNGAPQNNLPTMNNINGLLNQNGQRVSLGQARNQVNGQNIIQNESNNLQTTLNGGPSNPIPGTNVQGQTVSRGSSFNNGGPVWDTISNVPGRSQIMSTNGIQGTLGNMSPNINRDRQMTNIQANSLNSPMQNGNVVNGQSFQMNTQNQGALSVNQNIQSPMAGQNNQNIQVNSQANLNTNLVNNNLLPGQNSILGNSQAIDSSQFSGSGQQIVFNNPQISTNNRQFPVNNQQAPGNNMQESVNNPQFTGNSLQQIPGNNPQFPLNNQQLLGNAPRIIANNPQVPTNNQQFPINNPQQGAGNNRQFSSNIQQLPGNSPQFTGNSPQFPSNNRQPQFPANNPQLQGNSPQFPVNNPQIPVNIPQLPANNPQLSGNIPQFPANNPQLPGNPPQFPANNPQLSGNIPQFPANNPQILGNSPQFPVNNPKFPVNNPQFRGNPPNFPNNNARLIPNNNGGVFSGSFPQNNFNNGNMPPPLFAGSPFGGQVPQNMMNNGRGPAFLGNGPFNGNQFPPTGPINRPFIPF